MFFYLFTLESLLGQNIYYSSSSNPPAAFTSILEKLEELQSSHGQETGPDRLVREAAQGHRDVVLDILNKYPEKVGLSCAFSLMCLATLLLVLSVDSTFIQMSTIPNCDLQKNNRPVLSYFRGLIFPTQYSIKLYF